MDMGALFAALMGAIVLVGIFGGLWVVVWLHYRNEIKQRELSHGERMKSLELGIPLPDADVAKAQAEQTRARAATAIGILVPLILAAGAVLISLTASRQASDGRSEAEMRMAILIVVWIINGVITLVTMIFCYRALRRNDGQAKPIEIHRPADKDSVPVAGPSINITN